MGGRSAALPLAGEAVSGNPSSQRCALGAAPWPRFIGIGIRIGSGIGIGIGSGIGIRIGSGIGIRIGSGSGIGSGSNQKKTGAVISHGAGTHSLTA